MPIPIIAAAIAPQMIEAATRLGAAKDVCIFHGRYQPMIRKPGTRKRDRMEIPDPHWPEGYTFDVPAWLFILGLMITGSVAGAIVWLESVGALGGVKETLGLKGKGGKKGLFENMMNSVPQPKSVGR